MMASTPYARVERQSQLEGYHHRRSLGWYKHLHDELSHVPKTHADPELWDQPCS